MKNDQEQLIVRLKNNEEEALKLLYDRYKTKIYHFSLQYLRVGQEAEEVVQDAFVRIWQNRHNLDPAGSLDGYVFKTVKNLALNRIRSKVKEQLLFESLSQETEGAGVKTTEEELYFKEMNQAIYRAMEGLPEKRKRIFWMSRIDGFSNKEIADRLGISINTVEGQIRKALIYLRSYLDLEMLLFLVVVQAIMNGGFY